MGSDSIDKYQIPILGPSTPDQPIPRRAANFRPAYLPQRVVAQQLSRTTLNHAGFPIKKLTRLIARDLKPSLPVQRYAVPQHSHPNGARPLVALSGCATVLLAPTGAPILPVSLR